MNDDEIIEMAKQSGCHIRNGHIYNQYVGSLDQVLKRFAKLVAEKEREECALMVMPLDESLADEIRERKQE